MAREFTLSIGKLIQESLPKNRVVRINDLRDMASAVYRGRKTRYQRNSLLTLAPFGVLPIVLPMVLVIET